MGIYIDRNDGLDPNELSISDDEAGVGVKGSSGSKGNSKVDPNQLSISDDEGDAEICSTNVTSNQIIIGDEKNDVINFDDEIDISVNNSSSFLNLPPPRSGGEAVASKPLNDIINDVIQF